MKALEKRKTRAAGEFEERYRAALRAHVHKPREATLGQAYELGRDAIRQGKTLLDTLGIHHQVCRELFDARSSPPLQLAFLGAAGDFLRETLSTFEMTHRGFQEAVHALRAMNETLEERIKRLAYSVHDEASQLLVVVHLELASISSTVPGPLQEKLARIDQTLRQIEDQLRRFSHELRPTVLDDLGWLPAIEELAGHIATRSNLSITVETTTKKRLSSLRETVLYRVVHELLTNAVKHAQATRIRIFIRRWRNTFFCAVEDNGVGFDPAARKAQGKPAGLGFTAMRERLQTIGGTLRIDSSPGAGTKVQLEFPLEVTNGDSHHSRG
jgi:signal transduction histidine kinase